VVDSSDGSAARDIVCAVVAECAHDGQTIATTATIDT